MFAIFDLDHTLFHSNVSYEFGKFLYKKGIISLKDSLFCIFIYFLHRYFKLSLQQTHHQIFRRIFIGKSLSEFRSEAKEFFDKHWSQLISAKVVQFLEEAKRSGFPIAILSCSPHFLLEEVGKRFQVGLYHGTEYLIDPKESFVSVGKIMDGENKKNFILKNNPFLKKEIVVYTDSYMDLPLLEVAHRRVCINPDANLRNICISRGWEIFET